MVQHLSLRSKHLPCSCQHTAQIWRAALMETRFQFNKLWCVAGEDDARCQVLIEAHKVCLRAEGIQCMTDDCGQSWLAFTRDLLWVTPR